MPDPELVTPWSARLTLAETVDRLQANGRLQAISYLGSTGTDEWTDASDYDLLVFLNDYPTGYGVEATIVDQRITDVVFISVDNAVSMGCGSAPEGQRPDTAAGGGSGIG